jgi:hypothetical protein
VSHRSLSRLPCAKALVLISALGATSCLLTIDASLICEGDACSGGGGTASAGGSASPGGGGASSTGGGGADNLLQNPSFESWTNDWPDYWDTTGVVIAVSESTDAESGSRSLEISSPDSYARATQSLPLATPIPAGSALTFTLQAKHVSGPTNPGVLEVHFYYTDGSSDFSNSKGFPVTSAWGPAALEARAEHDVESVDVRAGCAEGVSQVLRLDSLTLTVAEP